MLVYGDTNSTVAGRARRPERCRVAHVEAGLRSFDLSMPEERNRIEVDRLSALLLCPDERSAAQLEREGVARPARGRRRRDGRRDAALRADRADGARPLGLEPSAYAVADDPPGGELPSRTGCGRSSTALADARTAGSSSRSHPRTRHALDEHGIALPPNVEAIEPLGYLEMLALVAGADAVVTDSGGLQKEAYWLRVPCVTLRPNTEWVDTVAAGANALVGAGRDSRTRSPPPASPPAHRRSTATATPPNAIAAALYA